MREQGPGLPRDLGSEKLRSIEVECFPVDDVPVPDGLIAPLDAGPECGRSDDDSLPELLLVQGGGEEANVVSILGPCREDLAGDDVIRIDEPHLDLAEGTEVAGPGFPASGRS